MSEKDRSFLSQLFDKLALTIQIEKQTGKSTEAAQKEVWRQIQQTSLKRGGNPITGQGATKSGGKD